MASILNQLIDQETGEVDMLHVGQAAHIAAVREFGSPDYPPRVLRRETDYVLERARTLRRVWRQHHGLPPEEAPVLMSAPEWGASGDSFGRR